MSKNPPYDSQEFDQLLQDWTNGRIARGEFEIKFEKFVDDNRRTLNQSLIACVARMIYSNALREKHGEDTVGVLMKCGVFIESPNIDRLANAIDEWTSWAIKDGSLK